MDSTVRIDGAITGDVLPGVVFWSEQQSIEARFPEVELYFSDKVEVSSDVIGVCGAEVPTGGDSLLLGPVDGAELSSAPSPCFSGVFGLEGSMKGTLGLIRRLGRRMTVGCPKVCESR